LRWGERAGNLPIADRLYLTLVEGSYEADTFFPEYSEFSRQISQESAENGTYRFTFVILEKS
jgi:dihydrofolate reductase